MLVIIKGAGDLASGIALRLWHCGFKIIMTDLYNPTSIRRTVCFSEAIRLGKMQVEDAVGVFAKNDQEILNIINKNQIAVIADPSASVISRIPPDVVVDAIIAKTNLGTNITEAPLVIGVGPGFTAGEDCHAVIETQRGHNLGKVIFNGSAAPNSGIPGNISGFTTERVLRAPKAGVFQELHHIAETVSAGDIVGYVDNEPVVAQITGTIRGLLPTGTIVSKGMKSGDIDPRCNIDHCYTVSDKARSIGGGVLEAILISFPVIKENK